MENVSKQPPAIVRCLLCMDLAKALVTHCTGGIENVSKQPPAIVRCLLCMDLAKVQWGTSATPPPQHRVCCHQNAYNTSSLPTLSLGKRAACVPPLRKHSL